MLKNQIVGMSDNTTQQTTGYLDRLTGIALSKIAKKIAEGYNIELVKEQEQQMRIALCEVCTNFRPDSRSCGLCKCPMDYKTTLKYNPFIAALSGNRELVSCPVQKW